MGWNLELGAWYGMGWYGLIVEEVMKEGRGLWRWIGRGWIWDGYGDGCGMGRDRGMWMGYVGREGGEWLVR